MIPALLDGMQDPRLRRGIAMALMHIGAPAVEPAARAMRDGTEGLAWTLVMLGDLHPQARAAVEEAARSSVHERIRAEAAVALRAQWSNVRR
jgi:hypothetical protein